MTEPGRILVGVLPTAGEIFVDGVDPVAVMVREAGAALDAERDAEQRRRLAQAADVERMRDTRRARAMRRLKRAFTAFTAFARLR